MSRTCLFRGFSLIPLLVLVLITSVTRQPLATASRHVPDASLQADDLLTYTNSGISQDFSILRATDSSTLAGLSPMNTAMVYDSTTAQAVIAVEHTQPTTSQGPDDVNWKFAVGDPPARYSAAMAYDIARGVTVLFGGAVSGVVVCMNDTWEWDGVNWVNRGPANNPPARYHHAMAYDSDRGVTVLFGGYDSDQYHLDDTWEWDGVSWTQHSPANHPSWRGYHALAYDSDRGVTVLFGGSVGTTDQGDTWEWDGVNWMQRSPITSPPARSGHALAYDNTRGVTVLFGGSGNDNYLNDTWEWDGVNWVQRSPATSPPVRSEHALAYDSAEGVAVLFGGYNGSQLDDTWEWNGVNWVQRDPASRPPARYHHAFAYDSGRGVTVLFGGYFGGLPSGRLGDTWEWDEANMVWRNPSNHPPERYDHALAYDSARGVTVLFGGYGSGSYLNDTWEWDGVNWIQHTPTTPPPTRARYALAYDSARGVTVLFGGYSNGIDLNDTWEWDGVNWMQRSSGVSPPARSRHTLAYDSTRGVTVLFGGYGSGSYLGDTWEWDGVNWKQCSPTTHPTARGRHAMAYDSFRGVTVLFGGIGSGGRLGDTWEWNGTNWVQCDPADSPPMRYDHALAYDNARGVTVLFGGYGSGGYLGDTWEWNGTNWMQRSPSTSPLKRYYHALAYDSLQGVTVLFGGYGGYNYLNDTWEWNGTNWVPCDPADSPPMRYDHALAYDGARGITVLYGGYSSDIHGYLNDTWEWDGMNWAQRGSATNPPARSQHAMAYDSTRGVTVLFGGSGSGSYLNDTWEWDGVNWIQRSPSTSPPARSGHALAYDSLQGVTVLFGGYGSGSYLNDTWEWDGVNWVQRSPATSPPARSEHALAANGVEGRIILFGGRISDKPYYLNDTWEWDGVNWMQNSPTTRPSTRSDHALAYDSFRGVTVLFGGSGSGSSLNDTWEWDGVNWVRCSPVNRPTGRDYHALAYDSLRGATVLFGGYGSGYLNDTWEYLLPLQAPIVLPITNPDGDGNYTVMWNTVQRAITYTMQEAVDAAFSSPVVRYTGNDVQFEIMGQPTGSSWYYRVRAANTEEASDWSTPQSVTVAPAAPILSPIVNVDWDNDYLVDWSDAQGATTYVLQEADNITFTSPITIYQGSASQSSVINHVGGTWYYRVRAANAGGSSPWSNIEPVNARPLAPFLYAIDNPAGDWEYEVQWATTLGATDYRLEEDNDSAFTSPVLIYQGTDTYYQVSNQISGDWYYRVSAHNLGGDSPWSNVRSVTVRLRTVYFPLTLRDYIAPFEGPWEVEPNDTWQQANGPLVSGRTYYGTFPSSADVQDYFSIYVRTPQPVELWLSNIGAGHNYDLTLRNAALQVVGYSGNLDNANEHIRTVALPTGWYYIQVYNRGGTGSTQPYHLRVVHPAAALTVAESELPTLTPLLTPEPPEP